MTSSIAFYRPRGIPGNYRVCIILQKTARKRDDHIFVEYSQGFPGGKEGFLHPAYLGGARYEIPETMTVNGTISIMISDPDVIGGLQFHHYIFTMDGLKEDTEEYVKTDINMQQINFVILTPIEIIDVDKEGKHLDRNYLW